MDHPTLLPLDRAVAERDAGMARAEANAPDGWNDEAYDFVVRYLERHTELHVDDLWNVGLPTPPNPRALGPVLQRAARSGLMVKTGEYRPSVRSHLSPKPVWESLICPRPVR